MVGPPGSTNRVEGATAIELLDVGDRQTPSPECSSTAELISSIASPSAAFPSEQEFKDFKFDETVSAVFHGRKLSLAKQGAFVACTIGTVGFAYLLARWIPKVKTHALTVPSTMLEATHVLVVNSFGQTELVAMAKRHVHLTGSGFARFVRCEKFKEETFIMTMDYRCNRFILDTQTGLFVSINDLLPICLPDVEENMNGLSTAQHAEIESFMGANVIEIERKSALQIFYNELLHPFYVFQVASFFIWIFEDYELYAFIILFMATSSAILTVIETKHNLDRMRDMARFVCPVKAYRDGKITGMSSGKLVPGDIVLLDEVIEVVPCDGVLVNGDAIVDECMLTGETVPVTKVDIVDDAYAAMLRASSDGIEESRFCLYSGTRLLRCRPRHGRPTMLLVTRTGFLTAKGRLVQSILFPRPNNFSFYRDSMLFVAILAVIAVFGFSVAIINFALLGASVYFVVVRALDIITVVVPPALPATMAIGTVFAIQRLEKQQIYCISPPRINVASKVEIFCFDKTGTLTEEGLEILGILPVTMSLNGQPCNFCDLVADCDQLMRQACLKQTNTELLQLMATCHSLRRIHGRLLGDSLDLRMFEFTQWELEELHEVGEAIVPTIVRPPGSLPFDVATLLQKGEAAASVSASASQEIGIIRQFDFDAKLRRMSTIARSLAEECLYVYSKGSPESLLDICLPKSIPANYSQLLAYYAHSGYRVIGCARKACPSLTWIRAQKMTREQAESDLTFLGFIVFENRLKPQTEPTIAVLRDANITNIMATGDNILTAISVGRASGLVEENSLVFYPTSFVDAKSSRDVSWVCVDDVDLELDAARLRPMNEDGRAFAFAISGNFFEWMHESLPVEYRQRVLSKCLIYARMAPQQKQLLVELLQQRPAVVGFCGDGANDCGALKAADVGVSLSQAEASIAAPFTSKNQNISCVPALLKEGRASLVTSFCCFKYMTLYSMIQFTTLIFLYSYGSTLSDGQFIYVDLLLIVPLGILMSRYAPSKALVARQPTAKLISPDILTAILGHIAIQALVQVFVYFVYAAPLAVNWDVPFTGEDPNTYHPSTSVMFLFSAFLYIGTALIFSAGRPFRERVYWPFVMYAMVGLLATLSILAFRMQRLEDWLDLTFVPTSTRLGIAVAGGVYFAIAFVFDQLMVSPLAAFIGSKFNFETR